MDQTGEEAWKGKGKNGLGRRLCPPKNIFNSQFSQVCDVVAIVLFYWCPLCNMHDALAAAEQQSKTAPATADVTDPEELTASGFSSNPTCSPETPPPAIPLLPDLPFEGNPSMGAQGTHSFSPLPSFPSKSRAALPVAPSVIIMRRESR